MMKSPWRAAGLLAVMTAFFFAGIAVLSAMPERAGPPAAARVVESPDDAASIYIRARFYSLWERGALLSFLLIVLDGIVLTTIGLIEYKRKKRVNIVYKTSFLFSLALLGVFLFPSAGGGFLLVAGLFSIALIFTALTKSLPPPV